MMMNFLKEGKLKLQIDNKFFRNKNAGDGVRTHDLQISEVKWKDQIEKGGGLLCTRAQSAPVW